MIREARLKAGLTQKELGEKLGISESAVNKLENANHAPTLTTLKRVAEATGLKLKIGYE
ncbi:helix-turn-helix transcriptional regulator [Spirosoma sp. BT702]|uniref:Helix-turn-helix transcriptional regulator n=1 Tax=Spirosoma profusum TaxID=2771354 RepID=A0A926Y4Z4_9BACT|nr:helix-turn-helix transcriptional regulator [Spirosoma profusum]MBD2703806.1 helix-turn-helix transcriptional regulator [Spirosoma profusum]